MILGASYYSGCKTPLPEFLDICASSGLNAVEIQMEYPYSVDELNGSRTGELLDLLSSYDQRLLLHGPYHDINLASLKEDIRRASVNIMKQCIDVAHRMDVERIVVHGGKCPADQAALVDRARDRMTTSLFELAKFAHERGVHLGIENKQRGSDIELLVYPKEHRDVVEQLRDLGAVAVVDLGHANTTGTNPAEFLNILNGTMAEVHLHDNNGTRDEHLPFGEGTLPVATIMDTLQHEFNGDIIIESKDVKKTPVVAQLLGNGSPQNS